MADAASGTVGTPEQTIQRVLRDDPGEIIVLAPTRPLFRALVTALRASDSPPTVRLLGRRDALKAVISGLNDPSPVTDLVRKEILIIRHGIPSHDGTLLISDDAIVVPCSTADFHSYIVTADGALPNRAFDTFLTEWLAGDEFWLPHAPVL